MLDDYMYKHNMTERQVARMTEVSKSMIHRIVSGETIPRLDILEKIAAGLHIRITDLFESEYK